MRIFSSAEIGVAVVMASRVVMQRMTDLQLNGIHAINCSYGEDSTLTDEERKIMDESNCQILFYELTGPMNMLNTQGVLHSPDEGYVCEKRIDAFRRGADVSRQQAPQSGT